MHVPNYGATRVMLTQPMGNPGFDPGCPLMTKARKNARTTANYSYDVPDIAPRNTRKEHETCTTQYAAVIHTPLSSSVS